MKHKNHISYKYYVKGELEITSPLIIASGNDEIADLQCIRDKDGKLFIPATTIAGNIRDYLNRHFKNDNLINLIFGSDNDQSEQSMFIFYDAELINVPNLCVRDGVALDDWNKTVKEKSKYDYEVINPETTFLFRMEVNVREKSPKNKEDIEAIILKVISTLCRENIRLGAKTRRGFGKIKLINQEFLKIDIVNEKDKWINFDWQKSSFDSNLNQDENNSELFNNVYNTKITADFDIPNSLIIRTYNTDPKDVDSVSISYKLGNDNIYLIPGTSWNGALRHSLLNIGRELDKYSEMNELIYNFFGFAGNKQKNKKAIRSKVIIEESKIRNPKAKKYVRNKIDRFTGGVVESALFDEKPIYAAKVTLNCEINDPQDYEIGMLILAIMELQNGFQSVGGGTNVGRGRLTGSEVNISTQDKLNLLSESDKSKYLNALATALNTTGGNDAKPE
ncbi:MAG: RAMP superfamily CRISPR-associated protein [Candidatus Cloacimonetes bacterium]|nr:RAMP superfamily CRISPR-associated protein [Candidatus Cloacimonadota bacterium]